MVRLDRAHLGAAPGEDLVGVRLVAHVEEDLVLRCVEHAVQGDRELDHHAEGVVDLQIGGGGSREGEGDEGLHSPRAESAESHPYPQSLPALLLLLLLAQNTDPHGEGDEGAEGLSTHAVPELCTPYTQSLF